MDQFFFEILNIRLREIEFAILCFFLIARIVIFNHIVHRRISQNFLYL